MYYVPSLLIPCWNLCNDNVVVADQLQTLDDDDRRHNKPDPSPYVPPPPGHCYTAIIIRLQCLNSSDHKVGSTQVVCVVATSIV